MTKTCSSEVDLILPGNGYDVPQGGRRKERHLVKGVENLGTFLAVAAERTYHKVLQECIPSLEVDV